MKVLIAGPCGKGFLPLSYARALEGLGHMIVWFDDVRESYRSSHYKKNRILRRLFRGRIWEDLNAGLAQTVREVRPDLVLAFKASFLHPETIREIRSELGTPIANYYPDNPYLGVSFIPDRPSSLRRDLIECLRQYDLVCIWEKGLVRKLAGDGVNSAYLPFGVDSHDFSPRQAWADGRRPTEFSTVFVGTWIPKRHKHIAAVRRHRVTVWGPGWRNAPRELWKDHTYRDELPFGSECANIYTQADVALNILFDLNMPGHNMRTFEIPASGGAVMVSTHTREQEEFFPEGEAACYYRDPEEMDAIIERLLGDRHLRHRIRANALRIARGHTYEHRARELLKILGFPSELCGLKRSERETELKISPQSTKRILIYRCGTIGDTIVSVPAINLVREHFRGAKLALMTAHDLDGKMWADDVLREFGWFGHFITYTSSELKRPWRLLRLLREIRSFGADLVLHMSSDKNSELRVWRDRFFFLMAGAGKLTAFVSEKPGFWGRLKKGDRVYPKEVDRFVAGLEKIGIENGRVSFDLPLKECHGETVSRLLAKAGMDDCGPVVGLCPWGKQPANRWPIERFSELGRRIIRELHAKVAIVGGEEEAQVGEEIGRDWPEGQWAVFAGKLGILETAELLRRSAFYLGNDTGAMHLAAAVGTPCVAIFSARQPPESWHPYGSGHVVLRKHVPCRNCHLSVCNKDRIHCLERITVDDVFRACEKVLKACAA